MLGSPCWRGCLVGLLATLLITLLRLVLDPLLGDESPRLLFTLPIMAAACLGGWLPGLITTVQCMAVIVYFFVEPRYTFTILEIADQVAMVTFLVAGICISTLCEWMLRHKQQAETARNVADQQRRQLEQEIIERKAIEQRLRAQQEELQLVTENAPVLLAHCDRDHRYLFVNRGYAEWFGLAPEEVIGKRIEDLLDRETYELPLNRVNEVYTGRPVDYEVDVAHPRLGPRHMHCIYSPRFDETGQVAGIVATVIDITERVKAEALLRGSEKRFRTVVEATLSGLILVARDGTILLINAPTEEMFGYSKEELLGHPIELLLPPRYRDNHISLRQVYLSQPKPTVLSGERHLWGIRKDGSEFPVEVGLRPVEMEEGQCVLASVVDITARRTAEQALQQLNQQLEERVTERTAELRESEQRFRGIFERAPIGITITSIEGNMVLCNLAYCQILGYSQEELQRIHFSNLIHPDDLADNLNRIQLLTTGEASHVEVENRYLHRNGSAVWVHKIISLLVDRQGKPSHYLVLATDITPRKRTEAALRESEARFRSAFELAPIGMSLVAPDGRYLQVNRPLCDIIGYTESELLTSVYQTHLHPDDLHLALAGSQRLLTGETALEVIETRCIHKTGAIRLVQLTTSIYRDPEGHPQYFISHVIDITDRKAAERALANQQAVLRQFIKSMPGAVAMFDREMRYLHLSDRWLVEFNLEGQDLIGRCHYEVFPGLPERFRVNHQRSLAGSVERCDEEEYVFEDGSKEWMQWECRPWYDAEGAIGGIILFILNITARHLAEEKLRTSLHEKEVLLREVHHRVKNNLQIISTLLDLQSDHTQDPPALEMFRESRDRVKAMALMHERMYRSKDLARIHFAEYVEQLMRDLKRTYQRPGVEIALQMTLDGTSLPLDQAIPCGLLLNELVSNCFKHAFVGRTTGKIEVFLSNQGNGSELTVADNGVGFPAHLDFRATTTFGLQLVQTLVAQLHGTIDLDSRAGSRFIVRFPHRV
ncbi:MAG: PAS domain S-box protein [Gemmataceae bacterium]